MTARFDNLAQVPLFGIVAILHGVQAADPLQTPPADPRGANAS